MSRFHSFRAWPLAALVLIGACSDGGPNQAQVSLNVATQAGPAASTSLAVEGTPETFTDGTNTLVIDDVRLVLREIELHRASAVSDCVDGMDDDCEELELGPVLVDLPLGTPGAARTFTVELAPGSYDKVEFELHRASSGDDAAFLQAHPELQDASVLVNGTYNGEAFSYVGRFDTEMEFNLVPPLTVAEAGATDLTLFVSLDSWFRNQTGSLVHPATANEGGPNQSLVEENIKISLDAFEDEDHDGRDDGPDHQ